MTHRNGIVHRVRSSNGHLLLVAVFLAIVVQAQGDTVAVADSPPKTKTEPRHPIAMVQSDGRLFVANRDRGTISIVDKDAGNVLNEIAVSGRVDDLIVLPDAKQLLAVDSSTHKLFVMEISADAEAGISLRCVNSHRVSKYPVSLASTPDGSIVSCVSKWSRRLTLIEANTLTSSKTLRKIVDLPFVPLLQCFLDDQILLVAAAHGGELAVVDAVTGKLKSHQQLIGHNIRGLSMTTKAAGNKTGIVEPGLLLAHQILNVASSTTRSTISWGGVISNTLHEIPIRDLLKSSSKETAERIHGSLFPLGREGQGAGDPADVVVSRDGKVYVALRGVDEVAMRKPRSQQLARVNVGRGPTKLVLDDDRNRLFVLCSFDDSLVEVDAESMVLLRTIRLTEHDTVKSQTKAGEELFYDARLSLDGWFSCHSCHSDGHSIGQLNDNFGDDSFGTPKRILTLLGSGETAPWAWSGSVEDLRDQIQKSIKSTMAGPGRHAPSVGEVEMDSLVAFVSSLSSAPGILAVRGESDLQSVARGETLFIAHGCAECHRPPTYTSPATFDVGIADEAGNRLFNPPSLAGVSQRGPYFHDNRATRLVDVLVEHDHDGGGSLSKAQIDDLINFLKSL
jgi:DNA-binding beta-propeller fold protein YncE